eukprot:6483889-Amphidinium_carterae.1
MLNKVSRLSTELVIRVLINFQASECNRINRSNGKNSVFARRADLERVTAETQGAQVFALHTPFGRLQITLLQVEGKAYARSIRRHCFSTQSIWQLH